MAPISKAATAIFTLNRIILLLVRRPSRTEPPGTAPCGCVSLEILGTDGPGGAGNQAGLGEIGRDGPLHGAKPNGVEKPERCYRRAGRKSTTRPQFRPPVRLDRTTPSWH